MANTHGFGVIIQASEKVIVKALKGAWKSANCPVDPGDEGRLPEFLNIDIPVGGLPVGGYKVIDGQVQVPQDELNALLDPGVNGAELILGLNVQLQIDQPPVPSAKLLSFHTMVHARCPIGTMPNTLDVGLLLDNLVRPNVWAVLDKGHPLDGRLEQLLAEFVHQAYEKGDIPHSSLGETFSLGTVSGKADTIIYDDQANPARKIITSFPDPATLRISIPIYLKMYGYPNFVNIPVLGSIYLASPMAIDARIIMNVPFEKTSNSYVAKFDLVTNMNVVIDPIVGASENATEASNYADNKTTLGAAVDLDSLLVNQLTSKGVDFAHKLGRRSVDFPSASEIEVAIAGMFFAKLKARKSISLWTPKASNAQFHVDSVAVKVVANSLNIALNDTGAGDTNAITNFIPGGMEYSIAMSKGSLDTKIQKSITDNGFDKLPKRFHQDGKDVDLKSLHVAVVDFAIRLTGTVTVIDAVLGSIDVDASFKTDVGLHWEPNGSLDANGFQNLKHHEIGKSDVNVDEGIAFWIVAIILTVVSFGVGGVFIGIITVIVILIVKAIVENIGSDMLVNGVSGAIDGITAWPPKLSRIGRVRAIFFDPVDISTGGLVISGVFNVLSSCESVDVIPAQTAGTYSTRATQPLLLTALRTGAAASYSWDPGDGTGTQLLQGFSHAYDGSGVYIAKHGLTVNVAGGASSRHFALVKVENVPPSVNAVGDLTVKEGQVVDLEAHFEDVEYADKHSAIWDFGDNSPLRKGLIEETNNKPVARGVTKVQHAWCDEGEYTVTVQVMDNKGGIGQTAIKVTVLNVPVIVTPPEKIYAYPCSPLTLTADFIDPGWCDTHTATWRFGDCSGVHMALVKETNEAPAAKGTAVASHTYKNCGTYYAECVVSDDDGIAGSGHTIVEVINLKNAFFNDGFTYNEAGKVANCWNPFFAIRNKDNTISSLDLSLIGRPANVGEVFYCEKCLIADGLSSQRIKTAFHSFIGIYQTFGANPDWEYQIGALYQVSGINAVVSLGLDPAGSTDPGSTNIVWSTGTIQNHWSHISQRVKASAGKVTVFIGLENAEENELDCCFDCVELIAMQNTKCTDYRIPESQKPTCIDFKNENRKMELPPKWSFRGVTFVTIDNGPNRITTAFAPDHTPGLELREGLIIEFDDPVANVSMEFVYNNSLYIVSTCSDRQGNVLSTENNELKFGSSLIRANVAGIKRIHLNARGEGAISGICFM